MVKKRKSKRSKTVFIRKPVLDIFPNEGIYRTVDENQMVNIGGIFGNEKRVHLSDLEYVGKDKGVIDIYENIKYPREVNKISKLEKTKRKIYGSLFRPS